MVPTTPFSGGFDKWPVKVYSRVTMKDMKKSLVFAAIFAIFLGTGLLASNSASAQDYGDSYSSYDSYFGGSGYSGGYDGGYSSYSPSYSSYDSYFNGGYNDPCATGGCGGANYSSYNYGSGCGSNCGGSFGYSGGCGLNCGFGGGFIGGCGSFCGGIGGIYPPIVYPPTYQRPPIYVPPPVVPPPFVIPPPPIYQPPVYVPPVYVPPVYTPPVYLPPVYVPPTIPPPVYYPPPVVVPPPLVCSITFSNFNPPLTAVEGQLYSFAMQAVSTTSNQITYRLVNGPDGLTVSQNGLVTWTPAFNQGRSGAYEVRVAAYNGGCETNQTFYVRVTDWNPVPPPAPKPKPCCECASTCAPVKPACGMIAAVPACAVIQPKPIVYGDCPPDASLLGVATPLEAQSGTSVGFWSSLGTAFVALWAALVALLYSPILLALVVIILIILMLRAYVRSRETKIVI